MDTLMRLPASPELALRLDRAVEDAAVTRARPDDRDRAQAWVEQAKKDVEWGLKRDELQALRPAGCFCLGTGREHPYDRNEVGHLKFCTCPEGQVTRYAFYEALQQERDAKHAKWIEEQFWFDYGIPARFIDKTFETHQNKTSEAWIALQEPSESDQSWYLHGGFGTGKTGLAVAYLYRSAVEGNKSLLFRRVPDILTELRATYNQRRSRDESEEQETEADLLDKYSTVGLLVLDDLGAEQLTGSGWVEDKLYQIIGARHDEELPTVFTSNLNLEAIAKRVGERITWRIAEMCGPGHILEVTGRNLRDWRAG